jgi:hypothetical protein
MYAKYRRICPLFSNTDEMLSACNLHYNLYMFSVDRFCGLVDRVPGYRSRGPGSIPGAIKFFWEVVGLGRGSLSLVSTNEELLERKSSGTGLENREYGRRDPSRWPHGILYRQKVGTHFADKRRSLVRCSSCADSGRGENMFSVNYSTPYLSEIICTRNGTHRQGPGQ